MRRTRHASRRDFSCDARGYPTGARELYLETSKGADLQFHRGNFVAEPFPVGETIPVRIDLPSVAATLEPGHRLALTASVGRGPTYYQSGGFAQPTITVVGGTHVDASRLVLPVVAGSFGGSPELGAPPPRPFGVTAASTDPITGPPPPGSGPSGSNAGVAAGSASPDSELPTTGGGSVVAAFAIILAVLVGGRRRSPAS